MGPFELLINLFAWAAHCRNTVVIDVDSQQMVDIVIEAALALLFLLNVCTKDRKARAELELWLVQLLNGSKVSASALLLNVCKGQ